MPGFDEVERLVAFAVTEMEFQPTVRILALKCADGTERRFYMSREHLEQMAKEFRRQADLMVRGS